ncbi:MAG: hypothetical protein HY074_04450 [Deltaproteobacteria bacterium]|nr:hypothetical protein [Deltaproteobacteria bacterium]
MENALTPANILDLTSKQTLFELAIEDGELIGHSGAKLIADLKERAIEAEYTHMYFRDPIRPGIVWFTVLGSGASKLSLDALGNGELSLPTRGRLDDCRQMCDGVFPGFLRSLEGMDEERIMGGIPPLALGVSAVELSTALEYIVFVHPVMTRAWAALIFTYDQMMGLKQGAESAREACVGSCPHAQVVSYLLGENTVEA